MRQKILKGSLGGDLGAGLTVALVSIPEGMAYALVAGVSPIYGLYTGMITTIVAALTGSSSLMIVTLTNALALVAGEQLAALQPDDPMRAMFTLTLLVGVIMTLLGAFRLGSIIRFVSKEVMAGFVFVTALLIVLGQLKDFVGYESTLEANKLFQAVDTIRHLSDWHPATTVVATASLVVLLTLKATPLRRYGDVLVILFATLAVVMTGWAGIEVVGDVAAVPRGLDALPGPVMPDLSLAPALLAGAFAATVVALSESSGVGAAFPNPDGTKTNMSKDFLGQGLGNIAGAFFQALPAGGSLSRTGINASGGARTRLSGVLAGLLMMLVLFLFGNLAELIPLAGLAALLIVIGFEVMIRQGRILAQAWAMSRANTVIAGITILSGIVQDLTFAIFAGVILSLLNFAVSVAKRIRVDEVTLRADGRWVRSTVPEKLAPDQITILEMHGPVNFATAYAMDELLPDTSDAKGATLILRVQDRVLLSMTGVEWVESYAARLAANGVRLIIAEVHDELGSTLRRTGLVEKIGEANIFPESNVEFEATERALASARGTNARPE